MAVVCNTANEMLTNSGVQNEDNGFIYLESRILIGVEDIEELILTEINKAKAQKHRIDCPGAPQRTRPT